MNTPYPTARPALTFFELFDHSLTVLLPGLAFLNEGNPADPFISR